MEQKVIQIGNSAGIILPKMILNKLRVKPGNALFIADVTEEAVVLSKKKQMITSSITPHFIEVLEKVNREYSAALKDLARR